MANNFIVGVYAGTFDPVTKGHLDIVKRAAKIVDKLIIGVAVDTVKVPIFSLEKRKEMIERDISEFLSEDLVIEVLGFEGLLVNFANSNNANILFRGLRAISDFEYEFQMACINSKLNSGIETVFLPASENKHFISSCFAKRVSRLGGDVLDMVSPYVASCLKDYFENQ